MGPYILDRGRHWQRSGQPHGPVWTRYAAVLRHVGPYFQADCYGDLYGTPFWGVEVPVFFRGGGTVAYSVRRSARAHPRPHHGTMFFATLLITLMWGAWREVDTVHHALRYLRGTAGQ